MNKEINIIIKTDSTTNSTPEWQDESFLIVSIATSSTPTSSLLGVGAKFLPSSYSNSISDFGALEDQILSDSALLPLGTYLGTCYGIDSSKTPGDILQSRTMTLVEKNALVLAISLHYAGYYVRADVNDNQTTYKEFLSKYNIPTCTSGS